LGESQMREVCQVRYGSEGDDRYARNAASLHRASRDLRFSGSLSPRKFVPFGRDRPL